MQYSNHFSFGVQDLKDEKKKARMAASRAVLEKCTMMLLTASKVSEYSQSYTTQINHRVWHLAGELTVLSQAYFKFHTQRYKSKKRVEEYLYVLNNSMNSA